MKQDQVHHLRAVEALRAGVPNRDVVRLLPPHQKDVEERFETLLEENDAQFSSETVKNASAGLLLEGDFGSGKSHWLERLRHVALEKNFVVSTVVLSKETPLHALDKLYRSAVESARAPGKTGPALSEIAHTYSTDTAPGYPEFFNWVHDHPSLDPRFAASLILFERTADEEIREKIINEWTGYPMYVSDLKKALKQLGETSYKISRPERGQILERFEFLSRLFRSAGFGGWVLLCDETEMISKYSIRQRGKSYAHLAQLLGNESKTKIPGLVSAFTITPDYNGQVLHGRKNDLVNIPLKLENSKEAPYLSAAKTGMRAIQRQGIDLRPLSREQLDDIYQKTRDLYSTAYAWNAPELENRREYSMSTGMREYLRSWVNSWDLRRLYNYEGDTVTEKIAVSYEEDTDLQSSTSETDTAPDGEPFVTL